MTNDSETTPEGAPFAVSVGGTAARPAVRVQGEIDVATAPMLRQYLTRLTADGADEIVLELDDVTFLDSSGLGVLLGAHKRLLGAGGRGIRVSGARDTVRRVLEITGLDSTFAVGSPD